MGILKVRDRAILWANQALADMLGYGVEELLGQSTRRIYASEADYERFGREAYPAMRAGKTFRTDLRHLRRDGSEGWFAVNFRQLPADGDAFIGVVVDITERKRYQAASEESRQRLELALTGSDLGM